MSSVSDWCFPDETVRFLADLKANNNRDWFTGNKALYEQAVKRPAEAYCEQICEQLRGLTGKPHKAKVFRIYRDVRFSKDKTPYNTHLHISFQPPDGTGAEPAWFFALEPGKLIFGAGTFAFDKPVLERFRRAVGDGRGGELAALLQALGKEGHRLSEPELKRVPRGFDPDMAHADLLRRKGLTAWLDTGDTQIASRPGLISHSAGAYQKLKPFFDWLSQL